MRKRKKIQRHLYEVSGAAMARERLRAMNRKNAVFIWIPKTAGSSVFRTLNAPKLKELRLVKYRFPNKGIVTFGHMDYAELVKQGYVSKVFDETAYKFAFSRNPYTRAVSLFLYLKRRKFIPEIESFRTFCRRLRDDGCEPVGLYNLNGMSQCNPQVRWVENVKMSFIGRVENITNDLEIVFQELGIQSKPLPHANRSTHSDPRSYYCEESKEIVEQFYKEDFEYFNYPIENF